MHSLKQKAPEAPRADNEVIAEGLHVIEFLKP
jgi:hypothetical protein